jgi:Icc-related predicted phosphoesterase
MLIDCISDLHGHYPKLDGGDLLIVAGDLTATDTKDELLYFHQWISAQNYKKSIIIAGNHDNTCIKGYPFYNRPFAVEGCVMPYNDIEYLCDSGTEFEGLKIWGSPWTRNFVGMNPHCKAFSLDTEEELAEKWALIPDDVDILITHSPPYGILDSVRNNPNSIPDSAGSRSLMDWMATKWKVLEGVKINVFGHIHEHGGKRGSLNMVQFINASHVNERYQPVNAPIRIIL